MFERAGELLDRITVILAGHAFLRELIGSTLIGLGVYGACALIVVAAELSQRHNMSVYRTRAALNDLAYAIFYRCSIFTILVLPIYVFLSPRLKFMKLDLFVNLPLIVSVTLCWLSFDFLNYWTHRLQHAVKPLWAFHSVHHAPAQLTFLTANRIHAVEQLYVGLLMLIPMFVLGITQQHWLPILFVQTLSEALQHTPLNWSFGRLNRFIVSPLFHGIHHSAEARHYNSNYGRVFSLWDVLFGTLAPAGEKSRRYGVDGMDVPERLIAQFLHPFRFLTSQKQNAAPDRSGVPVSLKVS